MAVSNVIRRVTPSFRQRGRAYLANVILLYVLWVIASIGWGILSLVFSADHHVADGWTGDPLSQLLWWTVGNFAFAFVYAGPIAVAIVTLAAVPVQNVVHSDRTAVTFVSVALAVILLLLVPRIDVGIWVTFALLPAVAYGIFSRPSQRGPASSDSL
jgi:hypothetical protein